MDAAAPSSKPKRDTPLFPPNYVSLRNLQELRLKEKEEQRQREEEAAARRVKEEAAAVAAPEPEMKVSSRTSFRHKDRPRGGQRFVEGTAMKKDGAAGGCRGEKGPDGDVANAPQGGGGKAENKGKEKVSAGTKDEPGERVTASSHGGKLEEKRKVEASGDQGTVSGTSGAPGEPAEASSASSRGRVRSEYRLKGKKGSGCRSTETATTTAPGETAEAADASPARGVKSENMGKKKPSVGRRADAAPGCDLSDGKRAQPRPAAEGSSNERSGGGQETIREAKSEGLGGKQPVVEVRVAAQRKPWHVGSLAGQRHGGGRGNGATGQHSGVWVPKAAAATACAEVGKFS